MATTTKKNDLPPKKAVKGGKLAANDSLTLVRVAGPARDLPSKKTVKAGKKAR